MGILTVFKKQAFAFENGISIKWESGPPHPAFCSKWESRLLFYNKNNEKQQGMNTKTFTICPFSINFEHLCVKKLFTTKNSKAVNTKTLQSVHFR